MSPDALKDYSRMGFMGVAVGGKPEAATASYFFTALFAVLEGLEKSMTRSRGYGVIRSYTPVAASYCYLSMYVKRWLHGGSAIDPISSCPGMSRW